MENTKMKLSLIVPIYGVEPYLRKCVDSLLHQDYDDYEIILVDDGGGDGCPAICDEYAAQYANIQVIHRVNGGLSAARNSGIAVAKGAYVCFVDSDDYWEVNVLGGLMKQIKKDNLDVLRIKWQYINADCKVFNPYNSDPYAGHNFDVTPVSGIEFLNTRQGTACYAWAYVIKASIARKELFTEGIYFEDTDWTPRMLLQANRVASTDLVVYNYLMREGSITHAVNRDKQRKVLEDKMRLVKELDKMRLGRGKVKGKGEWFDRMIASTVVSVVGILASDFWDERKLYMKELREMNIFPLSIDNVNKLLKRKIALLNINPNWALWLLHIKNK